MANKREGDFILNNYDKGTGIPFNSRIIAEFPDGTPITDADVDNKVLLKNSSRNGGGYSVRSFDVGQSKTLLVENVEAIRNLSKSNVLMFRLGIYDTISLQGYYERGDTPAPIDYKLSSTTAPDDGGSVIQSGELKFEHQFVGEVDIKYYGAIGLENIKPIFQAIEQKYRRIVIDGYYVSNEALLVTQSNTSVRLTNKGFLHIINEGDSNGISVAPNLNNISISGGTIEGSTTADTIGYAIAIGANTEDVRVTDVRLDSFTGGIMLNYQNRSCKFIGNSFYNMIYVPRVSAGGYGIVYQESYDIITSNNYFDKTVQRHHIYTGINPVLSTRGGENHVVSGNIFNMEQKDIYTTGFEYQVKFMSTDNVTCSGNTISGGVGGVWVTSAMIGGVSINSDNVNIIGNTIKGIRKGNSSYSSAIGMHGVGSTATNVNISDNIIKDCVCKAAMDLRSLVESSITNNIMYGITGHGIWLDYYFNDLDISHNKMKVSDRGIYFLPQPNIEKSKDIRILSNTIKSVSFGVFGMNISEDLEISDNNIKTETFNQIRIDSDITGLVIKGNRFKGAPAAVFLSSAMTKDSYIYDNIYHGPRSTAFINQGTGLVFEVIGNNNVQVKLAALPATTERLWVIGDRIIHSNPNNLYGWIRLTSGTANVEGVDWKKQEQLASTTLKGVVNQTTAVENITVPTVTTIGESDAQIKALANKVNSLLVVMRNAGITAT